MFVDKKLLSQDVSLAFRHVDLIFLNLNIPLHMYSFDKNIVSTHYVLVSLLGLRVMKQAQFLSLSIVAGKLQ